MFSRATAGDPCWWVIAGCGEQGRGEGDERVEGGFLVYPRGKTESAAGAGESVIALCSDSRVQSLLPVGGWCSPAADASTGRGVGGWVGGWVGFTRG